MYAVSMTGWKQYRGAQGDQVKFEKLNGEVGDSITFDKVLFASDGENVKVGQPYVDNSKVIGRIIRQGRNRKVIVFKYKRRKGYRRKQGHRQHFTIVNIEVIEE